MVLNLEAEIISSHDRILSQLIDCRVLQFLLIAGTIGTENQCFILFRSELLVMHGIALSLECENATFSHSSKFVFGLKSKIDRMAQ